MVATGGCLCGSVRFSYYGEVGPAGYCHCEDCRRCTGSAFNLSVRCELAKLDVVDDELSSFTKVGGSGLPLTRHFCRRCGSPVMTTSPRHEGVAYVKGGAWDDPDVVRPAHQSWTDSSVDWHVIDGGLPAHPRGRG